VQVLEASGEELLARTGNPPLHLTEMGGIYMNKKK
jgi:hypothetical protein